MYRKNNKYILTPPELSELTSLIKSGHGITQIKDVNSFGFSSDKGIVRVSKILKLHGLLAENNQKYKSNAISQAFCEKNKHKSEALESIKSDVIDYIKNGNPTTYDIRQYVAKKHSMRLGYKRVCDYLKSIDLFEVCVNNGKIKRAKLAKINGKKSAAALAGIELKPITPEIISRFQSLKKSGMYKRQVYQKLKDEFGYGSRKIKQLCEKFGYPENNPQTGKLNPMYGKSPSTAAGVGVKCWINIQGKRIFCRSSLELKIYCYLNDNNIKFNIAKHRVRYRYRNKDFTYLPDIVIDNTVYEIKPSKLITIPLNVEKYNALKKYCLNFNLKCGIITELTYDLEKYDTREYIDSLIKSDTLTIDAKNLEKLTKYLGRIKYENRRN